MKQDAVDLGLRFRSTIDRVWQGRIRDDRAAAWLGGSFCWQSQGAWTPRQYVAVVLEDWDRNAAGGLLDHFQWTLLPQRATGDVSLLAVVAWSSRE